MRREKVFCIYGCFSISRCINGGRKSLNQLNFQTLLNFYTTKIEKVVEFECFCANIVQLFQKHWQALLWMCTFCCPLQYYQNFMRNQEGKIELQKNIYRRICVRDITFLTARSPFYVFLLLSSSTASLFPSNALAE